MKINNISKVVEFVAENILFISIARFSVVSTNMYKGRGEFFNFLKICGTGTCYTILILESMTYREENTSFLLLRSFLLVGGANYFQL